MYDIRITKTIIMTTKNAKVTKKATLSLDDFKAKAAKTNKKELLSSIVGGLGDTGKPVDCHPTGTGD
jgi:hypothetical protein